MKICSDCLDALAPHTHSWVGAPSGRKWQALVQPPVDGIHSQPQVSNLIKHVSVVIAMSLPTADVSWFNRM